MRIPAVVLAWVLVVASSSARAGPQNGVAASANRALAALRASFRTDDGLHASAMRTLGADLKHGRSNPPEAFATNASALAFLLEKMDRACDAASAAFLAEASEEMAADADDRLPGAVPGDGGALDKLETSIRKELEKVRSRVASRLRVFERTFVRAGGTNTTFRAMVPPWEFSLAGAPSPAGVVPGAQEPPRLRAMTATRLPNGRVLIALAGTADKAYDGEFDVRMRGAANVLIVGTSLAAGGMEVSGDGSWSVSVELGNPFQATTPLAGNRVVQFGLEPADMGLPLGIQPQRLIQATTFGLP